MTRKSESFESLGIKGGVWRALLVADGAPLRISLTHLGQIVGAADVQPDGPGRWQIAATIPPETLSEGVQSYLLVADDGQDGQPLQPGAHGLGALSIMAGVALEQDLLAEIELLRAEIGLLKREFRRMAVSRAED